jgi:hypothetical protein
MRRIPALTAAAALLALLVATAVGSAQTPAPPAPTPTPAPGPCQDKAQHLRCPDLVMSAPFDMVLDRRTERGHVLLRASSSINNHGTGPLELRGHRRSAHSMRVTQIIYRKSGTRAFFPSKALLGFKFVSGERYGFRYPNFSYWKFRGAARFQLWQLDKKNRVVKLVKFGPKLFYCFRDLQRTRPSGRSPKQAVYPACSQNPKQRAVTLGTSVGWSDIYPYTYPEQYIDVTGLKGRFAYVQVADPFNRIVESNEKNNVSEAIIQLPSGRVLHRRTGLSAP